MFEIKITGSTAEEIRKDFRELSIILGLTGGQAPTKVDVVESEEVKQVEANTTQETPLEEANEPVTEEVDENGVQSSEDENVESTADKEQETVEDNQAEEIVTYTLEEVRAKASALQRAGKRDLVKSIITGAGASKLTEIEPQKYGWMMKCFEAGEVIE